MTSDGVTRIAGQAGCRNSRFKRAARRGGKSPRHQREALRGAETPVSAKLLSAVPPRKASKRYEVTGTRTANRHRWTGRTD